MKTEINRDVMLAIHREFPGAANAKYRTAIKNAIKRDGSIQRLYKPFQLVTYGVLGLDAINGVLKSVQRAGQV